MADTVPPAAPAPLPGDPPPHPHLWPGAARVSDDGRLTIGGVDAAALVSEYRSPLYVYDEATLRGQMRAWRDAITSRWPDSAVAYAAKAWLSPALCLMLLQEGLELDVVSTGEAAAAATFGFPSFLMHLHGNMKTSEEIGYALGGLGDGVGRVVIDSLDELLEVERASRYSQPRPVWLRVNPDVATNTHASVQTGHASSKFGIDLTSDEALRVVERVARAERVELVGLHAHAGSQLFDTAPIVRVVEKLAELMAALRERLGFFGRNLREISPGGGAGVAYIPEERSLEPDEYAEAVCGALRSATERHGLPPLRLVVEPGRSIVARAGVALYTTGPRKVRPDAVIVAVDGGMGDNPRPALYGARYHAALAEHMTAPAEETVQVVGRYCESGDILVREARLPVVAPGEVLAVPVSGAYQIAMASQYNRIERPAVVMVAGGAARLVRRRDSFEDLIRNDVR